MTASYGGHPIINPFGVVVRVSQATLRALDIRGYLHRDNESGLKGMDPKQYLIFCEAEVGTSHFYELGSDCSGPNTVVCRCPICRAAESGLEDSRLSVVRGEQAVREMRQARRQRGLGT